MVVKVGNGGVTIKFRACAALGFRCRLTALLQACCMLVEMWVLLRLLGVRLWGAGQVQGTSLIQGTAVLLRRHL